MPSEDYAAASTGALKLKGVASSSKIGKHKKKKKVKRPQSPDGAKEEEPPSEQSTELQLSKTTNDNPPEDRDASRNNSDPHQKDHDTEAPRAGKTEAELRHEERRRKRLDERLKREGIKTHKEKVEELNRYLSNLSEHHDMYVASSLLLPRLDWRCSVSVTKELADLVFLCSCVGRGSDLDNLLVMDYLRMQLRAPLTMLSMESAAGGVTPML